MEIEQVPVTGSDFRTVLAGETFSVVGYVQSSSPNAAAGFCTIKLTSLQGTSVRKEDTASSETKPHSDERFRYECQLIAPSRPGIYLLRVYFGNRLLDEASILVDKAGERNA